MKLLLLLLLAVALAVLASLVSSGVEGKKKKSHQWANYLSRVTDVQLASAPLVQGWVDTLVAPLQSRFANPVDVANVRELHTNNARRYGPKTEDDAAATVNDLVTSLQNKFPTADLAAFEAWGAQVYAQFEKVLSLDKEADYAPTAAHRRLRSLVTALNAAEVLLPAIDDGKVVRGLTAFTATSPQEMFGFTGYRAGAGKRKQHKSNVATYKAASREDVVAASLPTTFDMRTLGVVPPVRNQGACGCCYAFAAEGALSTSISLQGLASAQLYSVQEFIDCDTAWDSGCNGGDAGVALQWLAKSHALTTESAYPFWSASTCDSNGNNCKTESCKTSSGVASVTGAGSTTLTSDTDVMTAAQSVGGVVLTLNAACLQTYVSGVLTPSNCKCPTSVDHQVVIIGWNVVSGVDAWLLRNQWGTSWGMDGYAYIERGSNYCGIQSELLATTGAKYSGASSPTTKPPSAPPTTAATTAKPTTHAPTVKGATKSPTKAVTPTKPTKKPTNRPTHMPTLSPTPAGSEYEYEYEYEPPTPQPTPKRHG